MRTLIAGTAALALLALCAPQAQGQISIGPQITLADDVDIGIGAALEAPMASVHENLEFSGAFTLFFPDHSDYWELEGTVRYLFSAQGNSSLIPFALAGVGLGRSSHEHDGHTTNDTHVDLKFGGGVKAHMDLFTPFVELALAVGDGPDFGLRAGLAFALGDGEAHH